MRRFSNNRIVIAGATSAIAQAVARQFAARGASLHLIARDPGKLQALCADLQMRGAARVTAMAADLTKAEQHQGLIRQAAETLGAIDLLLVSHGMMRAACSGSTYDSAREIFEVNSLSVISLATAVAEQMRSQGHGTIAVITSVAGERGRKSLPVYAASKAATSVFLQGLRDSLYRSGVRVLDIRPGPVASPMTRHLPRGRLFATPERAAAGIIRAIDRGRKVAYVPWFWRLLMAAVRSAPDAIINRLPM